MKEAVAKGYRSGSVVTPVLHSIDFRVPRGECLFLAGPSGSGKTTLLSILGCVLSPDAGRVSILGQDITALSRKDQVRFRREKIGFVFQRFHLFDGLKAWENVRVAFDLLGTPAREGKSESLYLLEMVGLADRAGHKVSQLSMGQRQRVAIARALAGDPELILADEPTASLDAASGGNAMQILKDLCCELDKTAVVVTHDNRIFPLADRILTLVDGRIESESIPGNPTLDPNDAEPVRVESGVA
ncbi:MAG: ABC transporter ATP-binding protein [Planctomycetaceae bacterium]|nr:ABC transporter ATP-binding protein [Planctomycetaceae bacterium]